MKTAEKTCVWVLAVGGEGEEGNFAKVSIYDRANKYKKDLVLTRSFLSGGGKRDRTADLLHAMQALYQLSYTPEIWWRIRDSNPGHKDYDSSALTD